MIDLNSPLWDQADSAYSESRQLLGNLLEHRGDFRETVECLDNDLSHQLSFYNATAYALPHLADFCAKLPNLEDRAFLIAHLGAAIAAEGVEPLPRDGVLWQEFQEGLTALRTLTEDLVLNHMDVLEKLSGQDGQMFAVAALSILGDRRHAHHIYLYAPCDCVPVMCSDPECEWFCEEEDLPSKDLVTPADIPDWDGRSLDEEAVWFYGLLSHLDDEDFLPVVPYLYGTCKCYECDASGPLWDWIDRAYEGM